MKHVVIVALAAIVLSGCASAPGPKGGLIDRRPNVGIPDKPNPSREGEQENEKEPAETEDIEITEFEPDPDKITQQEPEAGGEDSETLVREQRERYTVTPRTETFSGGAVSYNYVPNTIYSLYVTPYKVTDIQLEPGEEVVSEPAAGDTTNFVLGTGHSFKGRKRVEHIYLKAVYAGRETTLTINTNKRSYQFEVSSFEELYMPIVSFRYPLDTMEEMRQEAQRRAEEIYLNGDIESFDFNFEIIAHDPHKPRWMPSLAFTDGTRTYLQFASAVRASYAPALFSIEGGERTLVNYRVVGDYYIIDRVLEHAELVLDVNDGNIVTIKREDS